MIVTEFNRVINPGLGFNHSSMSNNIPLLVKDLDRYLLEKLRKDIVKLDPNSKSFRKKLKSIKRIEKILIEAEKSLGHSTKDLY